MKILKNNLLTFLALGIMAVSCTPKADKEKAEFIDQNVAFASAQTLKMLESVGEPTGKNYPRTLDPQGQLVVTNMYDWTPGFFPGSLWYL